MDIDGLGNKIVDKLVDENIIFSIADLYKLDIDQLASVDGIGEKLAQKIINSIFQSKQQPWNKQLYGLGIQHIGKGNAKSLVENFNNALHLFKTASESPEKISSIYGIGKEITDSLRIWYKNERNKELLVSLKTVGITLESSMKEESGKADKKFNGEIFVLTGSLNSLNRREAQTLIEKAGGKVTSSVSKKTNYLIAGDNSGSKLNAAEKLGISILSEDEFKSLFNLD